MVTILFRCVHLMSIYYKHDFLKVKPRHNHRVSFKTLCDKVFNSTTSYILYAHNIATQCVQGCGYTEKAFI